MTFSLEYYLSVRHMIAASILCLGLFALPVVFVSNARAQINGTPASVTSPGFGGRAVNGTTASVTSLGPRGFAPNSRATFSTSNVPSNVPHVGDGHHHHHRQGEFAPAILYAVPVPYPVEAATDENAPDDNDPDYQGGPTIFDRRGSGANSYIPPARDIVSPRSVQDAEVAPAPNDPPAQPTLLIFRDGRRLEVGNYAILGATLFDLTPGHTRKVLLADLDLEETRKQNDDRGITFQLPLSPQAN